VGTSVDKIGCDVGAELTARTSDEPSLTGLIRQAARAITRHAGEVTSALVRDTPLMLASDSKPNSGGAP
jgi:hypothetical protein